MKKIFFSLSWILLSTGSIFISIAVFNTIFIKPSIQDKQSLEKNYQQNTQEKKNNAHLSQVKGVESVIEYDDARAQIIANFLKRYNSPLQPYDEFGQKLVEIADKYEIDYRLLPAIAMQESNLCKNIPENSFNCLGFGIHSKGTLTFDSYEANFQRAARELKRNYINQGLTTPYEIMTKYTPHSDGSWAESVNQWMSEMKYDDRNLGIKHKEDNYVLDYVTDETK